MLLHPEVRDALFAGGFWRDWQARLVYEAAPEIQWRAIPDLDELRLPDLAWDDDSARGLEVLRALAEQPACAPSVLGVRDALLGALRRELDRRAAVPVPPGLEERVATAVRDLRGSGDALEVALPLDAFPGLARLSYRGPGDGTEFDASLGFGTGLLIWHAARVSPAADARHLGPRFFRACEALALGFKIRRCSVAGALHGPVWQSALGYVLPPGQPAFRDPACPLFLETYKEVSR